MPTEALLREQASTIWPGAVLTGRRISRLRQSSGSRAPGSRSSFQAEGQRIVGGGLRKNPGALLEIELGYSISSDGLGRLDRL